MKSDALLLNDILDAIRTIRAYLPQDGETFDFNPPLQSHILRHLMIVGEASRRLSQTLKAKWPQIPWKQIEGMRHVLVNDYFRVDWNVVFATAKKDIPSLENQMVTILGSLSATPPA